MIHLYAEHRRGKSRGLIVTGLAFVALLLIFWLGISAAEGRLAAQRKQLLSDTLSRAAVTCFAVEGRYPPTLAYLTDAYGVSYDAEKYVVLYDIFASNIAPVINVLETGAANE